MCQLLRAAVHTAACAGVHVGRSQDAFPVMVMMLECRVVWHTGIPEMPVLSVWMHAITCWISWCRYCLACTLRLSLAVLLPCDWRVVLGMVYANNMLMHLLGVQSMPQGSMARKWSHVFVRASWHVCSTFKESSFGAAFQNPEDF